MLQPSVFFYIYHHSRAGFEAPSLPTMQKAVLVVLQPRTPLSQQQMGDRFTLGRCDQTEYQQPCGSFLISFLFGLCGILLHLSIFSAWTSFY